jgi:hypothetical protein
MRFRSWLVFALATALLAACGARTPAEIEAEKRKADEAWANQVAAAERARQAEEARLVQQEIDAHRSRAQADEARAQAEREQQERERDRLLDIVRSNLDTPQAARFANLRWNAARSALCGEVSVDTDNADATAPRRFVASGDRALLDSADADAHASYGAFETENECGP